MIDLLKIRIKTSNEKNFTYHKTMKNINKARLIIYIMGLILILSVFTLSVIPTHSHEALTSRSTIALPQDVHIPIDINTANKETLCLLDGIGEALADNIITYREEHGPFETKEELMNVHRIGEKTYQKIKNYICV